jgi:glycosyltransferase involved in cell wall biosynthesis
MVTGSRKILMVGPFPPTVGGITTYINTIIGSHLQNKYSFIPFTISRPTIGIAKNSDGYSVIYDIGIIIMIKSLMTTMYHIIKFPFVLLVYNPNIIHIHTTDYWQFWESSFYVFISWSFRKKIILHIHATSFNDFYDVGNKTKYYINKILSFIDLLILLSKEQKRFFKKIINENKILEMPNFVDSNVYYPNNRSFDTDDVIKILFIGGEEAKRKGIYDIVKSMPHVISQINKVTFIFIGRFNADRIIDIIGKHKLDSHVDFRGYVKDEEKRTILKNADIFLLPSYAEGLPIAILEAMSSGLPIITTKVGSIPEVIQNGENGYLINPGDYMALADKIVLLSKNYDVRKKMKSNNIKKIRETYDIKILIKNVEEVYNNFSK